MTQPVGRQNYTSQNEGTSATWANVPSSSLWSIVNYVFATAKYSSANYLWRVERVRCRSDEVRSQIYTFIGKRPPWIQRGQPLEGYLQEICSAFNSNLRFDRMLFEIPISAVANSQKETVYVVLDPRNSKVYVIDSLGCSPDMLKLDGAAMNWQGKQYTVQDFVDALTETSTFSGWGQESTVGFKKPRESVFPARSILHALAVQVNRSLHEAQFTVLQDCWESEQARDAHYNRR